MAASTLSLSELNPLVPNAVNDFVYVFLFSLIKTSNIDSFYDLFGGGFNVGINVNAPCVIYNDINYLVADLIKSFKTNRESLNNIRSPLFRSTFAYKHKR